MGFLLLADEFIGAIERYIYQCDVYVLIRGEAETVGVFALYRNSPEPLSQILY
jgi:hypothetical protein